MTRLHAGHGGALRLVSTIVTALLLVGCAGAPSADEGSHDPDREPSTAEATPESSGPDVGPGDERTRDPDDPVAGDRALPSYRSRVSALPPPLRRRMTGVSHDPGSCPVDLTDLRLVRVSHIGFDGRRHSGELVVRARHARSVVEIFERLYEARFPIRRMRPVDDYGGDDDRSMAANNTSAYNCRRVAGQDTWSDHAYGAAIDINPVQNPYVTSSGVLPPAGRRFADVDRSPGVDVGKGVIARGDVVVRAFRDSGWSWGGEWTQPDFQHFTAR